MVNNTKGSEMDTKNDNKKPAERPVPARMADGEAIAVYEVVFRREFPDLGFDQSGSSGRWRTKSNRTITYYPKLHLCRLEETYPDKPARAIFVPREWVSIEPLEPHHKV